MSSAGWLPSSAPAQCSTISRRCCGHPARIAPSRPGLTGPVNDEQARQFGIVHSSASHLPGPINHLLDVSRIEAGMAHPLAPTVRFRRGRQRAGAEPSAGGGVQGSAGDCRHGSPGDSDAGRPEARAAGAAEPGRQRPEVYRKRNREDRRGILRKHAAGGSCGHLHRDQGGAPWNAVRGVPAGSFAGHLETPVDSGHFAEAVVKILERAGGTS